MLGLPEAGLNYDAQMKTNEYNLQIARETNAANVQMARETNAANIEMNAENNLLQQQLANQAYQRSTASNQLAELMAAGYTQQQAMQMLAGGAQGASSFPVANTQPGVAVAPQEQMPSPLVAPQLNDSSAGALESSIFGALASSLNAPDGGALGWSVAQDYISGLMNFAEDGKIPYDKLSSPADFQKYIDSLEDGDVKTELQAFNKSAAARKYRGFVPAQRAGQAFFQSNMGFKTQNQQINESIAHVQDMSAAARLKEAQITLTDLQSNFERLNITHQEFQNQIADLCVAYQRKQNEKLGIEIDEEKIRKEILERTSEANIEATLAEAAEVQEVCCSNAEYYRKNHDDIQAMLTQNITLQIEQAAATILHSKNEQTIEMDDAAIMKTMSWSKKARHAFSRYSYAPFAEFAQVMGAISGMMPSVSLSGKLK